MVSLSHFLAVLLSTIIFLFFLHKWLRSNSPKPRGRLPPSPPKLPLLGNLHQLGSATHRSLQLLSRRHGPLMLIHFGKVPVLIASSAEAAREIMKTQDLIFSNRPKLSIPARLFYNNRDVAFAPYGEYWRRIRSICVLHLLSSKRVQSYRGVREEETSLMVEKIRRLGASSKPVNLSDVMSSLANDVICRVALGKKYGLGSNFKEILAEYRVLVRTVPLWEYIPWLSWTRRFDGMDERIARVGKKMDEFLEVVIKEHRARERRESELDFVDILLDFQRENASRDPIEDDTIKAIVLDVFGAGTDTTLTSLEWTMTELIRNPEIMKTLQNEVREVAGSKDEIDEQDLEKMPHLKAVLKESLRLHPPVPLIVPRELTQDTKVFGYDVASGTRVMINVWAISRDPSLWENPEKFHPERFLEMSTDFRGLHFEFTPFGAGRRGCPGITFAVAVDELVIAKLVQNFDFKLLDGAKSKELDVSESNRKCPLLVVATPYIC
ncbi:unspecific monooxygenase [Salvia divinorum]|uniref:Cytochrome P450 CYP71A99 n=1 Tax=Salvia divinorum TaxID=28513 RepID=A0A8E4JAY8_SALDI|nr:cytochrome P450 CYP71A99 [Salvia divinorum]QMS79252.1 cytochrome P450 CYP71A99 [synthetic construct]